MKYVRPFSPAVALGSFLLQLLQSSLFFSFPFSEKVTDLSQLSLITLECCKRFLACWQSLQLLYCTFIYHFDNPPENKRSQQTPISEVQILEALLRNCRYKLT